MRTLLLSLFLVACGGDEAANHAPKAADHKTEAKKHDKADHKAEAKKEEPKKEEPKKVDFASMNEEEQRAYLLKEGKNVYLNSTLACKTCHMENGEGQKGVFPPLKGQKEHMGDCAKHAGIVLWGMSGKITVDGVDYDGTMTPQHTMLDDLQIAAVISYERNSWGNDYGFCSPEDVKKVRDAGPPK